MPGRGTIAKSCESPSGQRAEPRAAEDVHVPGVGVAVQDDVGGRQVEVVLHLVGDGVQRLHQRA